MNQGWEHDDRTGRFEKSFEGEPSALDDAFWLLETEEKREMNFDSKSITALIVSAVIAIAFLFVVIAPALPNVIVPQTTQTLVFSLFAAMAGFGGSQYGEAQALKRMSALQAK